MSKFWQEVLWGVSLGLFLLCVMGAPAWAACLGGWVGILLRRAP